MADNRPFKYFDSQTSKFNDDDVKDQIRFQVSRNNVKEPISKGKEKVFKYLSSAVKTFHGKSFAYTDNIISKNDIYFAEFKGYFDSIEVNGIDLIKCDDGLIKEFKVFIRPIKGIEKVWNEMKQRLVEYDNNLS